MKILTGASPEMRELIEALGMKDKMVTGIQLSVEAGKIAELDVKMEVEVPTLDQQKKFREVLKRYVLVERMAVLLLLDKAQKNFSLAPGTTWDERCANDFGLFMASLKEMLGIDELERALNTPYKFSNVECKPIQDGRPFEINVNGRRAAWGNAQLTYEDVCGLAGQNAEHNPSITYHGPNGIEGVMRHGSSVMACDDLKFSCHVTGSA